MSFYVKCLCLLTAKRVLSTGDSMLVVAGGLTDRTCLLEAGFTDVVISNLDHLEGAAEYRPFRWMCLDAEKIALGDASFDWVIVHAGLHHLSVPAAGICEMFRVARKGIVCFEARDSWAMRLARRASLTTDYELEPAFLSGGTLGGYRNGPIPNYVYRWTEREFEKVVKSYHPAYNVDFLYFYGLQVPLQRFAMARSSILRSAGWLLNGISKIFPYIFPRQGNQFAMVAVKTNVLQPWLMMEGGNLKFREELMARKYDKKKYV
jgi:ubiquinone/menaquinone biosynthesis C-methylase UbiE